jgi:hypothetical protein
MLRCAGGLATFITLTALPAMPARAAEADTATTEVEAAVAEGSGTGTFGCSGQSRVRYVRAAVQVRHSQHSSAEPEKGGATVLLGAAVEGARVVATELPTPIDLPGEDHENSEAGEPRVELGDAWLQGRVGGHLRIGYRHPLFGIELGAGVIIAPGNGVAWVYPDAELTIGQRDFAWVFGGVGAAQLTTQLSYAQPYVGVGYCPTRFLRLEGRWGLYSGLDLGPADRFDLTWWVPISQHVAFRGGLALGQFRGDQPVSHEASIGLQFAR